MAEEQWQRFKARSEPIGTPGPNAGKAWRTEPCGGYETYLQWCDQTMQKVKYCEKEPLSREQYKVFRDFKGYVTKRGRKLMVCDYCEGWGHVQKQCRIAEAGVNGNPTFSRGCMAGTLPDYQDLHPLQAEVLGKFAYIEGFVLGTSKAVYERTNGGRMLAEMMPRMPESSGTLVHIPELSESQISDAAHQANREMKDQDGRWIGEDRRSRSVSHDRRGWHDRNVPDRSASVPRDDRSHSAASGGSSWGSSGWAAGYGSGDTSGSAGRRPGDQCSGSGGQSSGWSPGSSASTQGWGYGGGNWYEEQEKQKASAASGSAGATDSTPSAMDSTPEAGSGVGAMDSTSGAMDSTMGVSSSVGTAEAAVPGQSDVGMEPAAEPEVKEFSPEVKDEVMVAADATVGAKAEVKSEEPPVFEQPQSVTVAEQEMIDVEMAAKTAQAKSKPSAASSSASVAESLQYDRKQLKGVKRDMKKLTDGKPINSSNPQPATVAEIMKLFTSLNLETANVDELSREQVAACVNAVSVAKAMSRDYQKLKTLGVEVSRERFCTMVEQKAKVLCVTPNERTMSMGREAAHSKFQRNSQGEKVILTEVCVRVATVSVEDDEEAIRLHARDLQETFRATATRITDSLRAKVALGMGYVESTLENDKVEEVAFEAIDGDEVEIIDASAKHVLTGSGRTFFALGAIPEDESDSSEKEETMSLSAPMDISGDVPVSPPVSAAPPPVGGALPPRPLPRTPPPPDNQMRTRRLAFLASLEGAPERTSNVDGAPQAGANLGDRSAMEVDAGSTASGSEMSTSVQSAAIGNRRASSEVATSVNPSTLAASSSVSTSCTFHVPPRVPGTKIDGTKGKVALCSLETGSRYWSLEDLENVRGADLYLDEPRAISQRGVISSMADEEYRQAFYELENFGKILHYKTDEPFAGCPLLIGDAIWSQKGNLMRARNRQGMLKPLPVEPKNTNSSQDLRRKVKDSSGRKALEVFARRSSTFIDISEVEKVEKNYFDRGLALKLVDIWGVSKGCDEAIEKRVGGDGLADVADFIGDEQGNAPRQISHDLRVKFIDLPFRVPRDENDNSADWVEATVEDWRKHPSGCLAERVARECCQVDYCWMWRNSSKGGSNPNDHPIIARVHWTCTCCGYSGGYDIVLTDRDRPPPIPITQWADRDTMCREISNLYDAEAGTTDVCEENLDLAESRDRVMRYCIDVFFRKCYEPNDHYLGANQYALHVKGAYHMIQFLTYCSAFSGSGGLLGEGKGPRWTLRGKGPSYVSYIGPYLEGQPCGGDARVVTARVHLACPEGLPVPCLEGVRGSLGDPRLMLLGCLSGLCSQRAYLVTAPKDGQAKRIPLRFEDIVSVSAGLVRFSAQRQHERYSQKGSYFTNLSGCSNSFAEYKSQCQEPIPDEYHPQPSLGGYTMQGGRRTSMLASGSGANANALEPGHVLGYRYDRESNAVPIYSGYHVPLESSGAPSLLNWDEDDRPPREAYFDQLISDEAQQKEREREIQRRRERDIAGGDANMGWYFVANVGISEQRRTELRIGDLVFVICWVQWQDSDNPEIWVMPGDRVRLAEGMMGMFQIFLDGQGGY